MFNIITTFKLNLMGNNYFDTTIQFYLLIKLLSFSVFLVFVVIERVVNCF